jgi:ribulose 1,5-bisphosphate synthetase/thiazole synthase
MKAALLRLSQWLVIVAVLLPRTSMIRAVWQNHQAKESLLSTTSRRRRLSSFSSAAPTTTTPRRVAIIGGGLAGLSTAFHLLNKTSHIEVTIYDKAPVGTGGASAVAGGYAIILACRGDLHVCLFARSNARQ